MATSPTIKLSQLPALSAALKTTSIFPVTQDGLTYRATVEQLATAVGGGGGGSTGNKPFGYATIGDSITQAADDWNIGWAKKAEYFSNGTRKLRLNPSVGGYTVEQIRDLLLPQVLALSPLPKQVVISGGTNNTGSDATVDSGLAALQSIITSLTNAGIEPVLWTLPPQLTAARMARTSRWNNWVWRTAMQYGYRVLDAFSFYQDPATGLAKASMFADDLHPNAYGYSALGQWVAMQDNLLYQDSTAMLAPSNVYPGNLVSNSWFITKTVDENVAYGWSTMGTPTAVPALVADEGGTGFYWQEFTIAAGSPMSGAYLFPMAEALIPDNQYQFACLFDVDQGDPNAGYFNAALSLTVSDASWAALTTPPAGQRPGMATEKGMIISRFTAPAGAVNLTWSVGFRTPLTPTKDVKVRIAKPTLLNLTAAGLV